MENEQGQISLFIVMNEILEVVFLIQKFMINFLLSFSNFKMEKLKLLSHNYRITRETSISKCFLILIILTCFTLASE